MEQVIIVGAGPAGISAALYVKRGNLDPLVIHHGIGALEKAEKIENYYGLPAPVTGQELYENGLAQARALGIRILEAEVLEIGGFDTFEVKTSAGSFETAGLILATGSKRKAPAIPGLKEYEGRGVSYCAICDAFFYRNKKVAVFGNSDFALHEAEILSHTAAQVTIVTGGADPAFTTDSPWPVITAPVSAIEGENLVTGIRFGQEEPFLACDGIFIALGSVGSSQIARQIGAELNEQGNIRIDAQMQTSIPGLYAAGDGTGGLLQVAKAVYEGAVAGLNAAKYVRGK